jgi:hypothetical protein
MSEPTTVDLIQERFDRYRTVGSPDVAYLLAAVSRLTEERRQLERKFQLLATAVNDQPATCDPTCDSHGHSEACGARMDAAPAATIIALQGEVEALREALAAIAKGEGPYNNLTGIARRALAVGSQP